MYYGYGLKILNTYIIIILNIFLETIRRILVAVDGSKLFDASSEAIDLAKT
jgi:hypothetical protein